MDHSEKIKVEHEKLRGVGDAWGWQKIKSIQVYGMH